MSVLRLPQLPTAEIIDSDVGDAIAEGEVESVEADTAPHRLDISDTFFTDQRLERSACGLHKQSEQVRASQRWRSSRATQE